MVEFKRPFPTPETRRPLLAWTRSIPIAGEPADVADRMAKGWTFLSESHTPKLAMIAEPGEVVTLRHVERWRVALAAVSGRLVDRIKHRLQHRFLIARANTALLRRIAPSPSLGGGS